jgi:hypothetical protein
MINPCSICGEKPRGKAATVYWRWASSVNDWARFKGRYCATCFVTCILPVYQAAKLSNAEECIEDDKEGHEGEVVLTYGTLYTPKSDEGTSFQIAHCLTHLGRAREAMIHGAQDLSLEGSGSGRPVTDPWEAVALP